MLTEKRTLPIGVEFGGRRHRELEIRPRLVADMLDALEQSPRAEKDTRYYNLCMTACQILRLGEIPREQITGELLLTMYEADFDALAEAEEAIRVRVDGFRDRHGEGGTALRARPGEGGPADGAGGPADGVPPGGDPPDAA